jgi:hypothetical protein
VTPSLRRHSQRSGELCGRAADGEWSAGGSLSLDRYKMSSGFSEALMLCVTVTGLWVSEGRAEAISNYRLVCQECAADWSLVAGWSLVQ